MPLRSRSILLAVVAFLSVSTGLAQPQPSAQLTGPEQLRAAYDQRSAGSFHRSLRSFESLIDPNKLAAWDPNVQLTRSELLSHIRPSHNPDRELAALVDAYQASPHAPYAQIRRGLVALQRGHHGQARMHFDEAVAASAERDPNDIDEVAAGTAYYWLGIAHLTDPDGALHAQATEALKLSADDYPRGPFADDAAFALGQLYEERGDLDSAIQYYNRIVERYVGSENHLEAALRAAQSHLRLNRTDAARTILANVSSELDRPTGDPAHHALLNAEYHLLRAAADEQAGDFAAAERAYLSVAYSIDSPYRRTAMLGLADTYRSAGHIDSATAIYSRIAAESRTDMAGMSAEFQLAVLPLVPPFPPESLEPLHRIASDSAHAMSANARLTLAGIHYLRQDFAAAERLLDSAVDRALTPSLRVRHHLLRGAITLATNRYREADADLATALRLLRSTPAVLLPERDSIAPHVALLGAIAMIHAGRASDAVPQLNRLLETPALNSAEAMYWLGEAYYASGVLAAAVQTLEDLIERYPSSGRIEDALYTIGWAQFKQKKLERAEAAFARLVKAYPLTLYANPAHLRRGDCLYLMKKYAAALEAYSLVDTTTAHDDLIEYARYQSALATYHAEKRDAAGPAFKRFAETYPQSELADDALFMSGLVEYLERRYANAVGTLSQLTRDYRSSPLNARAMTTMAAAYYALTEFDSSRGNAERVLREFPTSAYASEADAALDRAESAIRDRDRQIANERERADVAFDRAREHRDAGAFEDAIADYIRIASRANDDGTIARAQRELALTYLLANDTVHALDAMRLAAAHAATDAGAQAAWHLADHFLRIHEADSAAHYYLRVASGADSSAALAYLRIGQAYLGNERWSAAADAFNMVLNHRGATPTGIGEARLGIAAVHAGRGELERARELFQQIIREHPGDEISRRAQEELRTIGNL
jgi:TolA-binding protein